MWDFNQYSTNNFVAEAEMPLVAVARGNMFQEYDVTALIKEPGQARKQKKCAPRRVCEPPRPRR